jgi:opacity protein-like surface antigen
LLIKLASRFLPTRVLTLTTCFLAMAGIKHVSAQTSSSQPVQQAEPRTTAQPGPSESKFTMTTDFSVGVFGQLTPTRVPIVVTPFTTSTASGQNVFQKTQGTSPSAGVLATFHQQFKPWLGYNVNAGYSRFTENYSMGTSFTSTAPPYSLGSLSQTSIGTNMFELSAAYVVEGPRTKRFSTFVQTGGALLPFLPTANPSKGAVQFRPALLFGTGLNYKLSEHVGVRAEYRGLFYKNPDFKTTVNKLFTVTNEPTVSLFYTFGGGVKKQKAGAATH